MDILSGALFFKLDSEHSRVGYTSIARLVVPFQRVVDDEVDLHFMYTHITVYLAVETTCRHTSSTTGFRIEF